MKLSTIIILSCSVAAVVLSSADAAKAGGRDRRARRNRLVRGTKQKRRNVRGGRRKGNKRNGAKGPWSRKMGDDNDDATTTTTTTMAPEFTTTTTTFPADGPIQRLESAVFQNMMHNETFVNTFRSTFINAAMQAVKELPMFANGFLSSPIFQGMWPIELPDINKGRESASGIDDE